MNEEEQFSDDENSKNENLDDETLDDETLNSLIEAFNLIKDDSDIDYEEISNLFGINFDNLKKDIMDDSGVLLVNYLKLNEDSVDPSYSYATDSGFDLYSIEDKLIHPFGRDLIPTGLCFDIPENYEIQIRSKSGLALNQGLMVLNSPGTVDQGYTGEIQVIIFNTTNQIIKIEKGQKIAQAVLCPVVSGKWLKLISVDKIKNKDRSDNGFGSTGL